jgi:hypothetical protein
MIAMLPACRRAASTTVYLSLLLSILVVPLAHAGWSADPVTIRPTSSTIPRIAACNDGGYGTFVAWQEESAPGQGVLRVQHVLPSGDLDPAWPADGVIACSELAGRSTLGALEDELGGLYLWWLEGQSFYLKRLDATGGTATGWPARGRFLGATTWTRHIDVIGDGNHGVYAAWSRENLTELDPFGIFAIHLGPSNTGAGGWPNSPRGMGSSLSGVSTLELWPRLALAPDGGIFIGWLSGSADTLIEPSRWRLARRTSAGVPPPGWIPDGIELGPFNFNQFTEQIPEWHEASLIDLASDGRGGTFVVLADYPDGSGYQVYPKVLRLTGDGSTAADWPAAGRWWYAYGQFWFPGASSYQGSPDAGLRVAPDGHDGAIVGYPVFYDHGSSFDLRSVDASGLFANHKAGHLFGTELVVREDGGFYLGSFYPSVTSGPFAAAASVFVHDAPSSGPGHMVEFHELPYNTDWFGDIGLASTGDGGAVLFWSQVRERFGLFARRFGRTGETTGVPAPIAKFALRSASFVSGRGLVASIDLPRGVAGRLELFDVLGRRVGDLRLPPSEGGAREIELRTDVVSGLYFTRLSTGAQSTSRKVLRLGR